MTYHELLIFLHIVGTSLLLGGAVYNGLIAAKTNLDEKTMQAMEAVGRWTTGALILLIYNRDSFV